MKKFFSFVLSVACFVSATFTFQEGLAVVKNKDKKKKEVRVAIVGMGPAGMNATETFSNKLAQLDQAGIKMHLNIFDPAEEAGGQVKSHRHSDQQVSELGAVIVFPSWQEILSLAEKYQAELKPAPLAFERLKEGGELSESFFPARQAPNFLLHLWRYRRLLKSVPYQKMFKEGTHQAPAELLGSTVGEWEKAHGVEHVVNIYKEFYSGCGYGQDVQSQPALYFPLLITWENIKAMILDRKSVKSFVNGYQTLWTTMARELAKKPELEFHYKTTVSEILIPKDPGERTRVTYELRDSEGNVLSESFDYFDHVIVTTAPHIASKIIHSERPEDLQAQKLKDTLNSAKVFNYRVTLFDGKVGRKNFAMPATRFFVSSYKLPKSLVPREPVLAIQFNPFDRSKPEDNHYMFYDYVSKPKGDDVGKIQLEGHGGVVKQVEEEIIWPAYHPHFGVKELKEGALQTLHDFNQKKDKSVLIAGAINSMGFTEKAAVSGRLAAESILKMY